MTKQSIVSNLRNISSSFSSSYRKDNDEHVLMFNSRDGKIFSIDTKGGTIYCNSIRVDNTNLIDFINDGKIIAILNCSFVEKIEFLV